MELVSRHSRQVLLFEFGVKAVLVGDAVVGVDLGDQVVGAVGLYDYAVVDQKVHAEGADYGYASNVLWA